MVDKDLLYKRIDAVHNMLQERQMSDWAKNYWTGVLNALIRKHKKRMH